MPPLSKSVPLGLCTVMAITAPTRGTVSPSGAPRQPATVSSLATRADRRLGAAQAAQTAGDTLAPVPLSVDLLGRLQTFSERWKKQPARVRDTLLNRPEYQQRFTLVVTDVKGIRFSSNFTEQVDMTRLAAAAPEVAAALKAVQLTARQWDQAMRSLYLTVLTDQVDKANQRHGEPATPAHRSVTWQNVEFLRAHPKVLEDLQATELWLPQVEPKYVPMASDTVNQHPY